MPNRVLFNDGSNDYYFEISDIAVNVREVGPWKAQFSSGDRDYSDLANTEEKTWQDLRGGIGLKTEGKATENRCLASDGVIITKKSIIQGYKVTTLGTFGTAPVDMILFGGSIYAIGNSVCKKWNTGTSAWDTADASALASPLDAIVVTDDTATYLVVSNSTAARYTPDGSTWSALTGCKGFLSVLDNRLCGFYGKTFNYSPQGDIDGSWATFTLSGYLGTVNSMYWGKILDTGEPAVFLTTSEGNFWIDFWTQTIWQQEISYPPHDSAGHTGMYFNGAHWIATGAGIKKIIRGGGVHDVGPDQDDGLLSGYQGAVYDMTHGSDWIVYCVNGGSSSRSSIYRRHVNIGGNQEVYTTSAINNAIACILIVPSTTTGFPRGGLLWGEGTNIKYKEWPDWNADPTEISGSQFLTSANGIIYPIFNHLPTMNKVAVKVEAVTHNCNANRYWTLYQKIDEASSWTSMGNFASSPLPTPLYFNSGLGTEFRNIQFKAVPTSNSADEAVELEALSLSYYVHLDAIRAWTFVIDTELRRSEEIMDDLNTLREKKPLLTFYPSGDSNGDSYKVKLQQPVQSVTWPEGKITGTARIQVICQELTRD